MSIAITLPVGIIVARERTSDPWQEFRWRPVSVILNAAEGVKWKELGRGRDVIRYHAATLPLVLTAKEKIAYRVNLANGVPSVYVVLREDTVSGSAMPVSVAHITASPFEIQAVGQDFEDGITDFVERVPMPDQLVQVMQSFVEGKAPVALPLPCANGAQPATTPDAKRHRTLPWVGDVARMKFSG